MARSKSIRMMLGWTLTLLAITQHLVTFALAQSSIRNNYVKTGQSSSGDGKGGAGSGGLSVEHREEKDGAGGGGGGEGLRSGGMRPLTESTKRLDMMMPIQNYPLHSDPSSSFYTLPSYPYTPGKDPLQMDATSTRFYDLAMASEPKPLVDHSRTDYHGLESSVSGSTTSAGSEYSEYKNSDPGSRPGPPDTFLPSTMSGMRQKHGESYGDRVVDDQHMFDADKLSGQPDAFSHGRYNGDGSSSLTGDYSPYGDFHGHHAASSQDYMSGMSSMHSPGEAFAASSFRYPGLSPSSPFSGPSILGSQMAAASNPMMSPYSPLGASSIVPPGSIIGTPGSPPPPGMKLAGYVTIANPNGNGMASSPNAMSGGMGMSGMNPYASSPVNPMAFGNPMMQAAMMSHAFANPQAMAQLAGYGGRFGPYPPGMSGPPGGPGGPGGPPPQHGDQSEGQKVSAQKTPTTTPSSSNTRSKILARLNPMNLFKRLKNRLGKGGKEDLDGSSSVPQIIYIPAPTNWKRMGHVRVARDVSKQENDTAVGENRFFTNFANGYPIAYIPRRILFPGNNRRRGRGGRRISIGNGNKRRVNTIRSEPRPPRGTTSILGSRNFEVIRGGMFDHDVTETQYAPSRVVEEEAKLDDNIEEDTAGLLTTLDDDFFSAGSPGILGFQGFNHFGSSNIYNTLSASNSNNELQLKEAESPSKRSDPPADLQAVP